MIKPCTILDLAEIAEDVKHTTGADALMYVRQDMLASRWFRSLGISMQFQIIGDHKVAIHIFGESEVSLETLRNWMISCCIWMVDNTDTTCFLVYCKRSDIKLRFLLRACGAKMTCVLPEGNGDEDELLYVFSKKDRRIYEEKITCHKQ